MSLMCRAQQLHRDRSSISKRHLREQRAQRSAGRLRCFSPTQGSRNTIVDELPRHGENWCGRASLKESVGR